MSSGKTVNMIIFYLYPHLHERDSWRCCCYLHVGWGGGSDMASLWRNSCTAALWDCPRGPSRGWLGLHGYQPKGAQQLQQWQSCSRQETARRGAEDSGRLHSSSCKRRVAGSCIRLEEDEDGTR